MQKPNRPLWVNKLLRVLQLRIGQAIENFQISGLPIVMVPCLHQCNVYVKRKQQVWRAQKCNFLLCAKTAPTCMGQQTTRVMQRCIGQGIEIFKILGLIFAMVPCLHQCKVYIKRKLRVWRAQKYNFLVTAKTAPTGTGQQITPCLAAPYSVNNRNCQNFGATFSNGTVFAPMQSLY